MGGVGSGAKPREYPPELVDEIRRKYESGMTIREIQAETRGVKVQNIVRRYGIKARSTAKRNQLGENNDSWKGDEATYAALHLRVYAARGAPSECSECGRDDDEHRYEWANLTGRYQDVDDYGRMCVPCHRRYDALRRKETGKRTSPRR